MKRIVLVIMGVLLLFPLFSQTLKEMDQVAQFDKPSLIVTSIKSGQESCEMREKFNHEGKVTERKFYNQDFQLLRGTRYHYSKEGLLLSVSELNELGQVYRI